MTAHDKLERLERELFHFTKAQTIALSVAIILALALAGLLAGTLMKQPEVELETPTGENGEMVGAAGLQRPVVAAQRDVAGDGIVFAASFSKDLARAGKLRAQTLAPEPVASGSPSPAASPAASPVASPTPATSPAASPTPGTTPVQPGAGVDLSGIVTVPTPPPWAVAYSDATQAALGDGRNNFVFAIIGKADPATDASGMMANAFNNLVAGQQQMSQIQVGQPQPIQPFGSLTSASVMAYQALWTDTQSSFPLMGNIWVGVRQDGMAFVMTAETTPPEDFGPSETEWSPVINGAYANFAGVQ